MDEDMTSQEPDPAPRAAHERQAADLNAFLVRFSDTVRGLSDARAVAATACRLVARELGVERAYWAEVDWTTCEYVIGAAFHRPGVPVIEGRFPLDEWNPGTSLQLQGRPHVVDDTQKDSRLAPAVKEGYARIAVGADLAMPVMANGQLASVLVVNQRRPRHWTPAEVALVHGIAVRCWGEVERARAEAALRASEARQAFLLTLADALRPLADADAVMATATAILGEELRVNRAFYAEIVGDDWIVGGGFEQDIPPLSSGAYPAEGYGRWTMDTLRAGRVAAIADTRHDEVLRPSERDALQRIQVGAVVGVPLVRHGQVVAVLSLHSSTPRVWRDDEIALVQETAERTWPSVERARTESALRASEERLRLATSAARISTFQIDVATGALAFDDNLFTVLHGRRWDAADLHPPDWRPLVQAWLRPEDVKRHTELVQATMRGEGDLHNELLVRDPDTGAETWIEAQATLVRDGVGGSGRVIGIMHNITDRKRVEAALHESEARQRFLLRLNDLIRPLGDADAIITVVCEEVGRHLGVGRCGYAEAPPPHDDLVVSGDWTNGVMPRLVGAWPLARFGAGYIAQYRRGKTVVKVDALADARRDQKATLAAAGGVRATIGVPLLKNGAWVALFYVHEPAPRQWTPGEITLMEAVAERTWAAVERARAEAALRASEARQAFLVHFSDTVRGLVDPAHVAEAVCRILTEQLGTVRTVWASIDRSTREYATECVFLADGTLAAPSRWPLDAGDPFAAEHLAGRTVVYDDIETDPRIPGPVKAAMAGRGLRSGIAVPVVVGGTLRAVVHTDRSAPSHWLPDEVAFVEALAGRAWAEIERARAEAALRESERRQAFLLAVSDALRPLTDVHTVQEVATRLLGEHLAVSWALYAEYDQPATHMRVEHDYTRDAAPSLRGSHPIASFEMLAHLQQGQTQIVEDLETSTLVTEATRARFGALGMRALLAAPIRAADDALVAALIVADRAPRPWTSVETALVRDVADRAWSAVQRVRAEAGLRESRAQLARELEDTRRLQAFSRALVEEPNSTTLYQQLVDAAMALLGADVGSLQLLDATRGELQLLAWRNFHPDAAAHWQTVSADDATSCGRALRHGARTIIPDVQADELLPGTDDLRYMALSGVRAVQSTPLTMRDGRLIGLFSTHWRTVHTPTERELQLLDILARQAADVLERRRAYEALRESETRLQSVLQIGTVGVLYWDGDFRLTDMNAAFLALTGFTRAEALGKSWQEFTPPEFVTASQAAIAQVAAHGEAAPFEKQYYRKDGSRWWGLFTARRVGAEVVEFVVEITAQKQLETERERRAVAEAVAAERQAVLRQVVVAQEEERRHVAHEVHDSLTQLAHAAALRLDDLGERLAERLPEEDLRDLTRARDLVRRTAAESRRLIAGLRPEALDDFGLAGAVGQEVEQLRADGWRPILVDGDLDGVRLAPEVEITLFRVAQEALTNVRKHTSPCRVRVSLKRRNGAVQLLVRDWGPGFEAQVVRTGTAGERVGLAGMRERVALLGGQFAVRSAPGRGTTIRASVPLPEAMP